MLKSIYINNYRRFINCNIHFDELESHLSPAELEPLYAKLQTVSDEKNVQIIVISHNPKTLNWYHKDALVFKLVGKPAITRVERFEHEKSAKSLFQYIQDLDNEL